MTFKNKVITVLAVLLIGLLACTVYLSSSLRSSNQEVRELKQRLDSSSVELKADKNQAKALIELFNNPFCEYDDNEKYTSQECELIRARAYNVQIVDDNQSYSIDT